ncbi:MAG: aminomethyltransferase family protein [Thermodesulfobacteriota bacterium]
MKELPLNELHKSLGANFGEYFGYNMPLDYGDWQSEYDSVRSSAGIIDLSARGKLRLSGKDHLKFLQGMLSNDVIDLEPGKGNSATVLTVKGRMIADMRVYKQADSILLDLDPGLNEKVCELLKKFRLSYKADIDDITDTYGLISLQGSSSGKLLELLFGQDFSLMQQYDHMEKDFAGHKITIACLSRTAEKGFDIYIANEGLKPLWEEFCSRGEELGIKPFGYTALNTLRIEAGLAVYGIDMDESNIPIEAGLWDALNFEKGCYVGQEVVARIKWRGHVNWHLIGFESDNSSKPIVGDQIFSGEKKIGRITSTTHSPKLDKTISMGYIRREFKDPGTKVTIKSSDESEIPAVVSEIPFYKGSL